MINLDDPKKFRPLRDQAHQVAMNMLRPISRKYDKAEHEYPKELDMLAAMIDGLSESGASSGAGASGVRRNEDDTDQGVKNGTNLASVMSIAEMCWGLRILQIAKKKKKVPQIFKHLFLKLHLQKFNNHS